jgi:hypothetical protein
MAQDKTGFIYWHLNHSTGQEELNRATEKHEELKPSCTALLRGNRDPRRAQLKTSRTRAAGDPSGLRIKTLEQLAWCWIDQHAPGEEKRSAHKPGWTYAAGNLRSARGLGRTDEQEKSWQQLNQEEQATAMAKSNLVS